MEGELDGDGKGGVKWAELVGDGRVGGEGDLEKSDWIEGGDCGDLGEDGGAESSCSLREEMG